MCWFRLLVAEVVFPWCLCWDVCVRPRFCLEQGTFRIRVRLCFCGSLSFHGRGLHTRRLCTACCCHCWQARCRIVVAAHVWPQASFVKLSSVWPRALGHADPCKPITGEADCKWVGAAIGWERRHFRYWWLGCFHYGLGLQMAERMYFASCWPGRALVRSLSQSCILVIGRVFWRGAEPSVPILFVFGTCIPDWRLSIRFEKNALTSRRQLFSCRMRTYACV